MAGKIEWLAKQYELVLLVLVSNATFQYCTHTLEGSNEILSNNIAFSMTITRAEINPRSLLYLSWA